MESSPLERSRFKASWGQSCKGWFSWLWSNRRELQAQISAREQAEQALRVSEAAYQSLVESLPLNVFRKDLTGKIVIANQRFCNTIGRPMHEVLGRTDHDLFPSDLATKYRKDDERVIRSGTVLEDIEQHARPDGSILFVQVLKAPVRDDADAIVGVQGMFWDVTARVAAEHARRQSDARFRQLVESNIIGVIVASLDGRIFEANDAFLRIVGYERQDLLDGQLRWDVITPPEHRSSDEQAIETLSTARRAGPWEKEYVRKDQQRVSVVVGVTMLEGSDDQCICFVLDNSEHKRAERELKLAKDAADSASRAKSQFLANMSHEIRTPMHAIVGITELMLHTPLNSEQREYQQLVLESSESLLGIINDILDFSKVEAGKLELEWVPFRLRDSVSDALRSLTVRIGEKDVELICDVAKSVPDRLVGDPHRLRQVLVNLVGNAIKFTRSGEVLLRIENEELFDDEVVLRFEVRDTGIGISQANFSKIFEAFEQADNSSTREHGGTGLGLAIVTRIVELLHGRVSVASEPGKGSTFTFTAKFGLMPESENAPPAPVLGPLRILIIDDNSTSRRVLSDMLSGYEMSIDTVASASDALARLKGVDSAETRYSVLIIDASLPETNGFALSAKIRESEEWSDVPIVLLTYGDRPDDLSRCEELGIDARLFKPVKQGELIQCLDMVTGTGVDSDGRSVDVQEVAPTRQLNILLAEDSLVNQKLAIGLLKRSNHIVTAVGTGTEALAAVQEGGYDLVLMDVQMPEMDGLEATRRIREWEKSRNAHIPIIAMTAHAMKGYRERCLEAGMDSYIAKPVRERELLFTISSLLRLECPQIETHVTSTDLRPQIDWPAALHAAGGDHELLDQLVEAFLAEIPNLQILLQTATERRDVSDGQRASHTIRGVLRHFGLYGPGELTKHIDKAIEQRDWRLVESYRVQLDGELVNICREMQQRMGTQP